MKGIILAGGTGSRLFPLTKVTNKHLLPIGKEPMIFHPIKRILETGIDEILIVTGLEHMGAFVNLLGSGKDFNCKFTYKVQDEAGGIAQALGLAKNFAGNDDVLVILGDNIFNSNISEHIKSFNSGATIFIQKVNDPSRYGVPILQGKNIIAIEEKPANPKSDFAVTGIYIYDQQVFDFIENLKPSARGELEITDVNNAYIKEKKLTYAVLDGEWTDAGTFESYYYSNQMVHDLNEPK
ncbi:MAG: spore coat protein [Candidatus Margulisbacteria bacterium GWF2_35_9]|nr:MAG: spore coat protein [Candidatus Margulisbacteria bacterium GWF2_35_9]